MIASLAELCAELRQGRPVVLLDDAARENEGDIVLPAELASPEWVNFMIREGRGLVCVSLSPARAEALGLPLMCSHNSDPHGTAFTVSVDHLSTTTGISAAERAATIRALADPQATPADFRRPGHVFPLRAHPGGVRCRPGHTEAAWELARRAGFSGTAAICEVLRDDGQMARLDDLVAFCRRHRLKLGRVAALVSAPPLVERVARTRLPSRYGEFELLAFRELSGREHLALVMGEPGDNPLVRLHSECLTGDALGSLRCDCGAQLAAALAAIAGEGRGVLLYLRQEGRGVGLVNKLLAYALQDQGYDTVAANERLGLPADARDFGVAVSILSALGIERLRLLTNNPRKLAALAEQGLTVERVPLAVGQHPANARYLAAKRLRLGHLLEESYETH